ncbi:NUDIX hydrolase [Candidatus Woesearchaeota archaeon]|nr:NUDIX hydrolase [Candidatus Woesearchaeota archaeon]
MQNRIRVGALLFKDNLILMVKHVNPKNGYVWWVPPGGGINNNETIFECAEREAFEEVGLKIKSRNIAYLRQFIYEEFQQNNIDIYITADILGGKETMSNMYGKGQDEHFIKELKWFSEEELKQVNVFPKILQTTMWADRLNHFSNIKFIGVERDRE